jgi:hypothetical protein
MTPEQSWLMTRVHAPGGNLGHFLFWVLVATNMGIHRGKWDRHQFFPA